MAFGALPQGHKQQEGDERTPEGRKPAGRQESRQRLLQGDPHFLPPTLPTVPPCGQVMIHGQRNGFGWAAALTRRINWSNGCIALSNADMEQVW